MTERVLDRYRLEQELGAGGMGVVYRATDTLLKRPVAIKMLHGADLNASTRTRILREAQAASALNHPGICTIYEVGDLDGNACIVMEHVEGRRLADVIPPRGLSTELTLRFGIQIAAALAHAHDRGIIHRDLKSANVIVSDDGRAKVLDFGLAHRVPSEQVEQATESAESLSGEGSIAGTLLYMSPDALEGRPPDPRDDLWALGVLLYEMASGEFPFRGETRFQLASSIQRDLPAPLPATVPAGLRSVIMRCLARERGGRYRDAREIGAALEAVLAHGSAPSHPRLLSPRRRTAAVALLALSAIAAVALAPWLARRSSPAAIDSIAVLPFHNVADDRALDYVTDGLTETVITSLAHVAPGKLRVIGLGAVQPYRGTAADVRKVGAELNVRAVLEGWVARRADRLSVTVELVNAADRTRIWGDQFDIQMDGLLGVQRRIAAQTLAALRLPLTSDEQRALGRPYTGDSEAYLLYLQGQHHWSQSTPDDYRRSLQYFQQAIARDSSYALAHAGLSRVLSTMTYEGLLPPDTYREVGRAATTALSLDRTLGAAHMSLAALRFAYEWDWPAAEREFGSALGLSPGDDYIQRYHGMFLRTVRRWDDAIAAMKRALDLNPLSVDTSKALGATYLWAGRHDQAIAQFRATLALDPAHAQTHDLLADTYAAKGMYGEALASRRTYLRVSGAAELADALGTDGSKAGYTRAMRELHRRYLAVLQEAAATQYVSPMEFALTYIALGDTERAFAALEQAFSQRAPWLSNLAGDPAFDPIRADPRFASLVRRVGIPHGRD